MALKRCLVRIGSTIYRRSDDKSPYTVRTAFGRGSFLYLACRNGNRPFGLQYRIGMRLPAATATSGKAALALEEEPAVRARFPDDIVAGRDGLGATTVDDLLVEFAEIRIRGCSVDDEETAPGMLCFGAALEEPAGKKFAVAISMIKASVGKDEYERFGKKIMVLARSLR